ncbi:YkyA family protein [Bacillaceae bacterium S4-13-58]
MFDRLVILSKRDIHYNLNKYMGEFMMKKLLITIFLTFALILIGCNSEEKQEESTPGQIVEQFLIDANEGENNKAEVYLSEEILSTSDMWGMSIKDGMNNITQAGTIKSIDITDELIGEQRAIVDLTITYKDNSAHVTTITMLKEERDWKIGFNQDVVPYKNSKDKSTDIEGIIYSYLEEAVTLEEGFKDQQQPLIELEQQEKDLYNQIIDHGMDNFEQIKTLSQEAINLIEKREAKLELEKESIYSAKQEFDKIEVYISDLETDEQIEKANALKIAMENRYNAYIELHDEYARSMELDKELYIMLQKEDIKKEEIEQQIDKVNDSYDLVSELNSRFNTLTTIYNETKRNFYDSTDLIVDY